MIYHWSTTGSWPLNYFWSSKIIVCWSSTDCLLSLIYYRSTSNLLLLSHELIYSRSTIADLTSPAHPSLICWWSTSDLMGINHNPQVIEWSTKRERESGTCKLFEISTTSTCSQSVVHWGNQKACTLMTGPHTDRHTRPHGLYVDDFSGGTFYIAGKCLVGAFVLHWTFQP